MTWRVDHLSPSQSDGIQSRRRGSRGFRTLRKNPQPNLCAAEGTDPSGTLC
jgi:hypothetical protein